MPSPERVPNAAEHGSSQEPGRVKVTSRNQQASHVRLSVIIGHIQAISLALWHKTKRFKLNFWDGWHWFTKIITHIPLYYTDKLHSAPVQAEMCLVTFRPRGKNWICVLTWERFFFLSRHKSRAEKQKQKSTLPLDRKYTSTKLCEILQTNN